MAKQGLQNGSINDTPPLTGSMTPLPALLPRSAPHPCTSSFSLSHAACSQQRGCTLVGRLCTSALRTSFGKQSLSCQPLLRRRIRNLPSQLTGRCNHLWKRRSHPSAWHLLRQGRRAMVPLPLHPFAGHSLAPASVCHCQSRGEMSPLCSLSPLPFQTFWCLVEQGGRKSHCREQDLPRCLAYTREGRGCFLCMHNQAWHRLASKWSC